MSLPARPLRAVCFDLDGTMFNTEEIYWDVGHTLLTRRGKQVTRALLDQMMGRPSRVALQIMIDFHGLNATVPELQAETTTIFTSLLDTRLALMPGLSALLDAIEAAGLPKAIATSSHRAYLDDVLARFQLTDRFAFALTGDDVQDGKPHPEIYLAAAQRLNVSPAEMLVLEDSENGCKAAIAAGAFTVAVPGDHSRQHNFSGVAFEADSLRDARIYAALQLPWPDPR
ncbi:MAG TPA: HAD-IA family hydrolase [Pirellulaceae bacterium]|nr:HAD-IA family hydrolase [Pirellulaceae bacterium]